MKAKSINTNTIGVAVLCYLPGKIHITHRKFQFGYSFTSTNHDIRSSDHYIRNGSNLMSLMPNSTISVKAKEWIKPWQKGSERGSTGCSSANTDASPAPVPLPVRGLQPDPSKLKRWKILTLFSFAHLLLHLHPLQNALLTLLSINTRKVLLAASFPRPGWFW